VSPDGSLTRVAGTGEPCTGGPGQFTGDAVPALQARLCAVVGLAVDKNGLLNLSEGGYSLVLRMNANGTIERIAGNPRRRVRATAVRHCRRVLSVGKAGRPKPHSTRREPVYCGAGV